MPLDTIEKSDILNWNSKEDIANTLEKRGLNRLENVGNDDEIVMELDDDKFVAIVAASGDETASDYNSRMTSTRQTQVVSTDDFEQFTFTTRRRAWDKHGQIKYNRWQIEKQQFRPGGEANTALEKLNSIEHGDSQSINQLYETKKVVNEFYDKFESIRADMVHKVSGISEDEGEKKQNYAQTIFDRLIFLHFIQEKKLLDYNQDYLEENHDEVIENGGDVYEEFYKPLFFKWLATDQEHPDDTLPYLNGGLFTETDVEREYENVRLGEDTEETNKLFTEILDFLGDWNWHADERLDIVDPNRLSPELLGHIFEKTVNQKEMGAYYTPEEITHFMSRNTIQPYILDRINEEFDKDYEEIDELFKIPDEVEEEDENSVVIGDVEEIEREEIEHLYFEVLQDLKVLDPAVGSGAFLLAAQEVLIDIYMSALQYFQKLEEKASWEMTEKIQDIVTELEDNAAKTSAEKSMHAKRQIILNNLYGVDIDKGATEICKLRLWLSIVADLEKGDDPHAVETLPNIDFNIRQGNSLIGFTEPIEKALDDDIDDENSQFNLKHYEPGAVKNKYHEIIKPIKKYKEHQKEGNEKEATKYRQEAFKLLEEHREKPDRKILQQFREAGIEDVDMDDIKEFSPFHWVLEFAEVYSEGGFDVIIGNPPWEEIKGNQNEFFVDYDPLFDQRSTKQKDKKKEELLNDEEIKEAYENYNRRVDLLATYFKENNDYELQQPVIDGRKQPIANDLSALFTERLFSLAKDESYYSFIVPNVLFSSAIGKSIREEFLENKSLNHVIGMENKGAFAGVDDRYKFSVFTGLNSGKTENIRAKFMQRDVSIFRNQENLIDLSRKVLANYSPDVKIFPMVEHQKQAEVLNSMVEPPQLRDQISNKWNADLYYEIKKGPDNAYMTRDKEKADYPIYQGENIYQFAYNANYSWGSKEEISLWSADEDREEVESAKKRVRGKNIDNLKNAICEEFKEKKSGSKKAFVNDLLEKKRGKKLTKDDVRLDCQEYRIVFRLISNATNERTFISSVIPKDNICLNSAYTIRPQEINVGEEDLEKENLHSAYDKAFEDEELFAASGLLNSIAFDFIMRTKIDSNVVQYMVKETRVPRLSFGDNWFNYISERAAKLNCYGPEFEEMRERLGGIEAATDKDERKRLQAEIDAAAFHAYGLDRDETKYVLDNFHTVDNPRMMTEDYFDMVLEKFDELDEEGPLE